MIRHIIDDLESSPDDSDDSDEEQMKAKYQKLTAF